MTAVASPPETTTSPGSEEEVRRRQQQKAQVPPAIPHRVELALAAPDRVGRRHLLILRPARAA